MRELAIAYCLKSVLPRVNYPLSYEALSCTLSKRNLSSKLIIEPHFRRGKDAEVTSSFTIIALNVDLLKLLWRDRSSNGANTSASS